MNPELLLVLRIVWVLAGLLLAYRYYRFQYHEGWVRQIPMIVTAEDWDWDRYRTREYRFGAVGVLYAAAVVLVGPAELPQRVLTATGVYIGLVFAGELVSSLASIRAEHRTRSMQD